jgi:hypothetical protein
MNICYRRILEVKVLRSSFWSWSSLLNKRWKVSIKYHNPHYEHKWNYYHYVYIPVKEEIYVEHSNEIVECRTESGANRLKEELERWLNICQKNKK